MATFSVAIMANETWNVMARITEHYLNRGAEVIYIFWDGPPEILPPQADTKLRITICNVAFWERAAGLVPSSLEDKQDVVYRQALADCGSDWLLVVDADEYLITDRPLCSILDDVPAEVQVLRLPNVEAVWGPGDEFGKAFSSSYFRRAFLIQALLPLVYMIYGIRVGKLMRAGLVGYVAGKSLVRSSGRYDRIGCHCPMKGGKRVGQWAQDVLTAPVPLIAHYDAISQERWREKFRRRFSGEVTAAEMRGSRQNQVDLIRRAAARSDAETARLFRSLYKLNRLQYATLHVLGLAFRRSPDNF